MTARTRHSDPRGQGNDQTHDGFLHENGGDHRHVLIEGVDPARLLEVRDLAVRVGGLEKLRTLVDLMISKGG